MSAYLVSHKHIDAILTGYASMKYVPASHAAVEALTARGKVLLAENVRSVAHRYSELPETSHATEYVFKEYSKKLTPVTLLKLCDCLEYQSCETDDYFSTDAYSSLNILRSNFIAALPGYDDAEWSI